MARGFSGLWFVGSFCLIWAIMLFCSATVAFAYDTNISKVEVTGRAAISDNQTRKARRHALQDALYLAALKTGVDISGTSITNDGILIRNVVKLDTQGRLVDFNILSEKNNDTHYEITLQAFFAKRKFDTICPKPRYPSVKVMKPSTKVASNVNIGQTSIADYVARQVIDGLVRSYAGPITESTGRTLSSIKSEGTKDQMFDYQSLQSAKPKNMDIREDFIFDVNIFSQVKNDRLESHVKLALIESQGLVRVLDREHIIPSKLPPKTPLRALNILLPKNLKVNMDNVFLLVNEFTSYLKQMACKPLEAKTIFASGQLKLALGTNAGVKKGALAYVISGGESWTLLQVSRVSQNSATLQPINTMNNPKTLANLTVRFIEGVL